MPARVRRFESGVRPLLDIHRFTVCGRPDGDRTCGCGRDHDGFLAMEASRNFLIGDPPSHPTLPDDLHIRRPLPDIRDGVRDLCRQFPDEYHRQVDAQHAYPGPSSMH